MSTINHSNFSEQYEPRVHYNIRDIKRSKSDGKLASMYVH
jgi:hypothetical protein